MPIVGVPKTIDNDIVGTTNCFGFDTAVSFATEAIDRLHTTAAAHRRIMVVEVMGRYAGWIALHAGIAGGGDVDPDSRDPVRHRQGGRSASASATSSGPSSRIVVVRRRRAPEGRAALDHQGGRRAVTSSGLEAWATSWPHELELLTGKEARTVVLGHLQRGGTPTAYDRVLATRFGARAVDLIMRGQFGKMVASHPPDIVPVSLSEVVGKTKTVPEHHDMLLTARSVGISFGD